MTKSLAIRRCSVPQAKGEQTTATAFLVGHGLAFFCRVALLETATWDELGLDMAVSRKAEEGVHLRPHPPPSLSRILACRRVDLQSSRISDPGSVGTASSYLTHKSCTKNIHGIPYPPENLDPVKVQGSRHKQIHSTYVRNQTPPPGSPCIRMSSSILCTRPASAR